MSKSLQLQDLMSKLYLPQHLLFSCTHKVCVCFLYLFGIFIFSSVRLRTNSSLKKSDDVGDLKKGQRLIEKEAMETGKVIQVLFLISTNDTKIDHFSQPVFSLLCPEEVLSVPGVPACHGLGIHCHGLSGLLHCIQGCLTTYFEFPWYSSTPHLLEEWSTASQR